MILTFTFLVVTMLHPTQPTVVAPLHQKVGQTVPLKQTTVTGVQLKPAQPTIVTTWSN